MDAPLSSSGLFGDAVNSVVEKFQESSKQAAAFQEPLPCRIHISGAAEREQPQTYKTSSSYHASQKQSAAYRAPPHKDWGHGKCTQPQSSKGKADLRTIINSKKAAGKRSWRSRAQPIEDCPLGVSSTEEAPQQVLVMKQEVKALLEKRAIEYVPHSSISSRYFIVPKKDGGCVHFLDLRVLKDSVMQLKFKMLTLRQIVPQIRSEDWFVTRDLKDAYFHISILPCHRNFLRFAFGGKAYQHWVLPFGLALSLRTFTKCEDAALVPLRLQGIRIMNYINDWLILAQSHQLAVRHWDVVLPTWKRLRLNDKKSSPLQRTTFLGVVWGSTSMQACLSPARIESILSAVKRIRLGQSLTVKQFQRLLGLMAAASNVIPFGLLYMRTLQWWLRTKGFSPKGNTFRMSKVMRRCFRALVMWKKPWFLSQGPVLGASCHCKMLMTDTSLTGWGAVLEGCSSRGLWKDHHLSWHIKCLEMLAVFFYSQEFPSRSQGPPCACPLR